MSILDFLFPKKCLECGKYGKYICEDCLKKVSSAGWNYDGVYSIWKYEGVIRKAIIALKYKYATEMAKELSDLCVQRLKTIRHTLPRSGKLRLSANLVPIPLHRYRQNFRGFNQSEEIGRLVAKSLGWKFIPDLLIRKKLTTPQVELKGPARRQNIQGVFVVNPNYSLFAIRCPLVLFDDVFTTGSTIKEAARVLKNEGFKKIWGLTIAR